MNTLIVCASRYGSTEEIGTWIAERLDFPCRICRADEEIDPADYDLVIMGSGVYSHTVLPALASYAKLYKNTLAAKKTAVFGVAMDLTGVYVNGKVHGGWSYISPFINNLPQPPIHAGMLSGEINPAKLRDKDKAGLKEFYKKINNGDDTIPFKTRMNKQQVWEYAEKLMQRLDSPAMYH